MTQRGRASVTASELDCTDVPLGKDVGTLAEKVSYLFLGHDEMRVNIMAAAAVICELINIVGTPAYMLVFLQFLREVDVARVWLRTPMQDHPHDHLDKVPLRKEGSYRSLDFGAVRGVMSDGFMEKCNSFYALLSHLEHMCTGARDEQLFRFLCEVQVLLDLLVVCIR